MLTKEDKIKKIRQVCISANPEIAEWRCYGCWKKYAEYLNGCSACWRDDLSVEQNNKIFPRRKVIKIIREIRLADVLLTLKEKDPELLQQGSIDDGESKRIRFHIKFSYLFSNYNLKNDNLENQSEETINLIYDLLK